MDILFNRQLYLKRLIRTNHVPLAALHQGLAQEVCERLSLIKREIPHLLLITPEPIYYSEVLKNSAQIGKISVLHPRADEILPHSLTAYDGVISVLDLHLINDVPGQLIQLRQQLKPDGVFLACFFAGQTLTELRQSWARAETDILGGITPRIAPFIDVRELGQLMQRTGFAMPVADCDQHIIHYKNLFQLFSDIRSLALTNCLNSRSLKPISRPLLAKLQEVYGERFSTAEGKYIATLDIAWALGWAPHPDQPKALKPGSATRSLAQALNTKEQKFF